MKDPYRILGISKKASADAVKKAYRRLARETHPDSKPGDKRCEDRFKEISNAYALLSDTDNRRRFDDGEIDVNGNAKGFAHTTPRAAKRPSANKERPSAKTGKSRFDHFFKDRARKRKSSIKAKGANISYTLSVPFVEAALGANKTVRMATGKTLKFKMPPATEEGQVLRLSGQGMKGMGGGKDGDALVEIKIAADAVFSSTGLDVHSELSVSIDEAVLGGKVNAPTINGIVSISIPQGANSGTRLRLKGRGIITHKGKSGDHYVTLKVVLPVMRDRAFVDFVRTWTRAHAYNPRAEKQTAKAAQTTTQKHTQKPAHKPKRKIHAAE